MQYLINALNSSKNYNERKFAEKQIQLRLKHLSAICGKPVTLHSLNHRHK